MKFGLFGVFGCGNFGNDATLDACLQLVARSVVPTSSILCIAANPTRVAAEFEVCAEPMTEWPSLASGSGGGLRTQVHRLRGELANFLRAWKTLRQVETLVIAGTGVLDDQHTRPVALPLDIFRWSLAARLAGARLVFLAVGAGPIDHRWSRILLTNAVRLAHEVSYRDERSLQFMRSLADLSGRDRVLPDLALSLPSPERQPRPASAPPDFAVGLLSKLNWRGRDERYRAYEDRLVELIRRLAQDGSGVWLLKGDDADSDTLSSLISRPELAGLPVHGDASTCFDDVLATLTRCSAMVGSRYHNVVAAVVAGVPAISLAYGPKNTALLEQLGHPQWCHDIDDFSVDEVERQARAAAGLGDEIFAESLAGYRSSLQQEFDRLAND